MIFICCIVWCVGSHRDHLQSGRWSPRRQHAEGVGLICGLPEDLAVDRDYRVGRQDGVVWPEAGDICRLLRGKLEGRSRVTVEVRGGTEAAVRETLARIPGVQGVEPQAGGKLAISVEGGKDIREEIFRAIVAAGFSLLELRCDSMTLEDIFVRLTAHETADPAAPGKKVAA